METGEGFYGQKQVNEEELDYVLDYVIEKLGEIELKLIEILAIEEEINRLLNEMKQKMMAKRALIAEKEQGRRPVAGILDRFKYN